MDQNKMWEMIEKANWSKDHNYERIGRKFKKLSYLVRYELFAFIEQMMNDLNDKFEKDWLGKPGIPVSDDGWSDLRAEVIGRGQKFYKTITVDKLRKMAIDGDYYENFTYCMLDLD